MNQRYVFQINWPDAASEVYVLSAESMEMAEQLLRNCEVKPSNYCFIGTVTAEIKVTPALL